MHIYKDFHYRDNSNISVEYWRGSQSVEMHGHDFYELSIIEKGSCTHFYDNRKTLLIPGDSFLVPPHHAHGFDIHNHSSMFIFQFLTGELSSEARQITSELCFDNKKSGEDNAVIFGADINKQGIYHLDPDTRTFAFTLIGYAMEEQKKQGTYFQLLKKNYLEAILILLKRVVAKQYKNYIHQPTRNQAMMVGVLTYIEANITEEIDFVQLANQNSVSPNHFRKLFKDFTGLPPVEYINRLRIVKARDHLLSGHQSMSEVAASVGIYDSNYFSRLFKQYMGCSPKRYIPQAHANTDQQTAEDDAR